MRAFVTLTGAVLIVVAVFALLSAEEEPAASFPEEEPTNEAVSEATISQVLRDPESFADRTVIVRGGVTTPLGPSGGFVLENGGRRILVYAPSGVERLEPGESVGVRAEVVRFTEPAAGLLGDALEDPDRLAGVPTDVGDPYLVFRAITRAEAGAADIPDLGDARRTLAAIAARPETFYGDPVTVAGEAARVGRRTLVLSAGGEELLVVPQSPPEPKVEKGALVRAKGIVVPFDSDQEDAALDEREDIERYDGRASLSATVVAVLGD